MPSTSDQIKLAFIRSLILLLGCQGFTSRVEAQVTDRLREFFGASAQTPHPAVVRVVAQESGASSMGSGCLIWADGDYGWVISNWHVVRDATGPVEVIFPDGFRSPAQVTKTDETWDLALLGIWRPPVPPVILAEQIPRVGDDLMIAGYGRGSYRQARGTCRHYAAPDPFKPHEMIELSVAARQGDSGGPILNARGELAGVLFGSGSGMTTGSHVGRVRQFLADVGSTQIASKERPKSPFPNQQAANGLLPVPDPPAFTAMAKSMPLAKSIDSVAGKTVPPPFFPSTNAARPADRRIAENRPLPIAELDRLQIGDSDPLPFEELISVPLELESAHGTERVAAIQQTPAKSVAESSQRVARLAEPSDSGWTSRADDREFPSDAPAPVRPEGDRNPLLLEVQAGEKQHSPSNQIQPVLQLPLPLTDTNAFLVFVSLVATLIYALPRGTSKERPGSSTTG